MIYYLSLIFLFLQFSFMLTFNPLILCIILVLMSVFSAMFIILVLSKWLAVAVVLIFLGGMMVMFFYATSLSNNDKFLYKMNLTTSLIFLLTLAVMPFLMKPIHESTLSLFISNLYGSSAMMLVYMLMFYLLTGLFLIVKMTFNFEGSLVKSF